MSTLSGSIEADVPLDFADREWSEYIRRSLYSSFPKDMADTASSIADTDAESGIVRFQREPDGHSRVSVELDYSSRGGEADVAGAQRRLDRDLDKYRDFVLRRCEQEHCRAS